jgi:POT family proton-dependent oligopeptide transporter
MQTTPAAADGRATWFGHPRGLFTLFMTEMWERFTYYGMRAILVLFLVAAIDKGGLGIDDKSANAIYGLYISGTYVLSLLGGWIADRIWGAQKAVWWGGVMIMVGNGLLAMGQMKWFFVGLLVIMLGVSLLKPNISAIVAQVYPEGGARRDAGFSIFYMGINLGAFLGSTFVPIVADSFGWSAGFGLPAIGMLFGLIQFSLTKKYLYGAGAEAGAIATHGQGSWTPVLAFVGILALIVLLAVTGTVTINPVAINRAMTAVILVCAVGYFTYLGFFAGLDSDERKRVVVMFLLFLACAMFWAGFEQAGASLNLFADRYTDLNLGSWKMPAGVLQNINPFFIILFSPIFAALWVNLGRRNLDPSAPVKFALGLILMGVGFIVMYFASQYVVNGEKVLPTWLILTYLFHTFGELCLSPVGLSSFSKLAPARFVGQALGVWFMATALGNNLAGQIAGEFDPNNLPAMPGQFLFIFWWGAIAGLVLLLLSPWAKKLIGDAK